ncbi:MAG: hypothetical protein JNG88_13310 [Phycisphaerales bacterium]|nr:hypothetical protein [Phycisphaerales bacterium]
MALFLRNSLAGLIFLVCVALPIGCERSPQTPPNKSPGTAGPSASSQPATPAFKAPAAAKPPLNPESKQWTREQAAAHLDDAEAAVSAAIRLIELGAPESPHLTGDWTAERVKAVRVMPLGDAEHVFGVVDEGNDKLLKDVVRIAADGGVAALSIEEMPNARVYASPDRDLFPTLVIGDRQIRVLSDLETEALTIEAPETLRFDLREKDDITAIVLMLDVGGGPVEAARYRWDPYELTFIGPACDQLPDPPGGKFQLDLKRSAALTPMGGELPPPPKIDNTKPPPEEDGPIY